jgi:hypothetical protein
VPKVRTHEEKLFGAAVVKMGFLLRGTEASTAFRGIYPGLLQNLPWQDTEVDEFIKTNRARVEAASGLLKLKTELQ